MQAGSPADSRPAACGGLKWLDALQTAFVLAALALCLRGTGQHWLALVLAGWLPAARCLAGAGYRERVRSWFARHWAALEAFRPETSPLPWRGAFVWVVLPAALFYLCGNHALVQGDSRPVILTAGSLVREGDWDIREFVLRPGGDLPYFAQHTRAGIHSSYPSGMVPFALPVAAAARLLGADLSAPQVHERLEKWTAAWLSGACLGLFFLLARHLAGARPAWVTTLLLATGSAMFTTVGQGLWQHGGVIFWGLVALLVEFRRAAGRAVRAGTPLQGLACGAMVACRLSSALFVLTFGAWVLLRAPRRALGLAAWAAAVFAPWALLYASIYGNPFGPSVGQLAAYQWSGGLPEALAAVLVSPGRGLLVYQPWLWLGLLTCLPALRRRTPAVGHEPAGWPAFCAAFVVLHLLLISTWGCWWGGWCWGSRLASEMVPFLGLLCIRPVAVLWRARAGRALVLASALAGLLLHLPAVYLRADRWNDLYLFDSRPERRLWSWRDPPFLYPVLHRHDPAPGRAAGTPAPLTRAEVAIAPPPTPR
jgi:hypothetical protein